MGSQYLDTDGFKELAGDQLLPENESGGVTSIDDDRIDAALTNASGVCRAYIPKLLIDSAGDEIAFADVAKNAKDALPGICYDLARWELADENTGEDDKLFRAWQGALDLLALLGGINKRTGLVDEDAADIEGGRQTAQVFSGASDWLPGLRGSF